jgi:hypothetical protein
MRPLGWQGFETIRRLLRSTRCQELLDLSPRDLVGLDVEDRRDRAAFNPPNSNETQTLQISPI